MADAPEVRPAQPRQSFWKRYAKTLKVRDDSVTKASELTVRQSLFPLALVTTLFFLWGFAYGLLDTLNKHFQKTLGITRARSSGLQAAYFGAYPLASLGYSNWILRHYGYKTVFMFGLTLYGIGALLMWPAGLKRSFGGFCGATFVIGSGLGSLETAANPYLAVCGPPRYAEIRINFAQAFNAIGTIVGPVLGSYAFFKETKDSVNDLKSVQWVYLAIAVFVFILAFVFFVSPIAEVTDADMQFQADETHGETEQSFWKNYNTFVASFSQFCYVGSQVAIAGFFINYVTESRIPTSNATAAKLLAGAQGCFTVGRFSGTLLMKYTRPRLVFLVFLTACIIFTSVAIKHGHNTGLTMLNLTLFFESICFPTIVALGIRGLGKHTKRGSGFIVGGVAGGAVVPPILGATADHRGTQFAMVIPVIFFILAWIYPLMINFMPSWKLRVDQVGSGEALHVDDTVLEKGLDATKEIEEKKIEDEAGTATEEKVGESGEPTDKGTLTAADTKV